VNFNLVQDTNNPNFKTARQRLEAHRTEATCAGCHKIMDPAGLALENFDTSAASAPWKRRADRCRRPARRGEVHRRRRSGQGGSRQPSASACVVNRVYQFGAGHKPNKSEASWLTTSLAKDFSDNGYKFAALLKDVATSDVFYRATPPQTGALDTPRSKLASDVTGNQEVQK